MNLMFPFSKQKNASKYMFQWWVHFKYSKKGAIAGFGFSYNLNSLNLTTLLDYVLLCLSLFNCFIAIRLITALGFLIFLLFLFLCVALFQQKKKYISHNNNNNVYNCVYFSIFNSQLLLFNSHCGFLLLFMLCVCVFFF